VGLDIEKATLSKEGTKSGQTINLTGGILMKNAPGGAFI